jgi:hypothetical protein
MGFGVLGDRARGLQVVRQDLDRGALVLQRGDAGESRRHDPHRVGDVAEAVVEEVFGLPQRRDRDAAGRAFGRQFRDLRRLRGFQMGTERDTARAHPRPHGLQVGQQPSPLQEQGRRRQVRQVQVHRYLSLFVCAVGPASLAAGPDRSRALCDRLTAVPSGGTKDRVARRRSCYLVAAREAPCGSRRPRPGTRRRASTTA